jgi:hypothetical protein
MGRRAEGAPEDLKVEDALPDLRDGLIALGTGSFHSKAKGAVCFVF